jgi:hypothetical protein
MTIFHIKSVFSRETPLSLPSQQRWSSRNMKHGQGRWENVQLFPREAQRQEIEIFSSVLSLKCETSLLFYLFIFNYALQPFKVYCAIWARRSNFRHQAFSHVSPRESTQRRKVELWARNAWKFYLNAELHVTFRDLLHAVKLRHGTDDFTSPPKEGVLRIFSP